MTKILVVEDEPGIALNLEDTLRLEGYDVENTDRIRKRPLRSSARMNA
jgi:DNA-binding response OmpR family regulator